LNVSLSTEVPAATDPVPWLLSAPQKQAELLPLVRRATECIVHKVTDDPRYRADMRLDEVNDLIVDLLPACGPVVRAMMDTHDRMYGTGSGRAFLLGPYLDVLPSAVVRQVRAKVPQQ
jgi:hypothetical protein